MKRIPYISIDHFFIGLSTVGLLAMTCTSLLGEENEKKTQILTNALQPEVLELVSQGEDKKFHLAPVAFAPTKDDPNLIVIALTNEDAGSQTVIRADDLATMKEVKSTSGKYFFRVGRGGYYEVALVAEFPWPGTWTLNYQFDDSAKQETACKVLPGQEKALHILPVPAMRKGFHDGIHQLKFAIPGAGKIHAILLRHGKPFEAAPVKKALAANTFQPKKGTARFLPVQPIGVEVIEGIQALGSDGRIDWEISNAKGQTYQAEEIKNKSTDGIMPLVITATLYRDAAGESAILNAPEVLYQVDPKAIARLANDHLSIEVDRRSGRIGKLIHPPTGRIFRQQAELPFRLLKWDAEEKVLVPLDPERFVCRKVTDEDGTLTMTYEDVGVKKGERIVTFRMALEGEQLKCSMKVDNQTDKRVRLVHFPYMSGVAAGENPQKDVIAWAGSYLGPVMQTPGYLKDYHTPMMMFVSLSDGSLGFYLGAHDAIGEADRMVMKPVVGNPPYDYTIAVNHTIEPGDVWSSQTHVIALPEGDWHAAANIYRNWYRSVPRYVTDPAWLKYDYPGALNIYLGYGQPFSSVVDFWKQAKWRGTFFLKLNGAGGDGFGNNFYPYPSPLSGGPERLRRAVEWINAHGGQVCAYTNMRYYIPSWEGEGTLIGWTPRWLFPEDKEVNRLHGLEWTLKNAVHYPDGSVLEGSNGGPHRPFQKMWLMSFRSQAWYDYWQYWIPYYAKLGLNVYWDQAMLSTYRCGLPVEQRRDPDANYSQGAMATARDAVDEARKYKSDFVIRGEGLNDRMMRYMNLGWLFLPNMINPIYRYTLPDQVLDQTVFTGDYQKQYEEGFLYQMRIIGGAPWGKGWGMDMRDLTQMRLATHDVAFRGRYMDNMGLRGEDSQRRARYVVLDEPERQAVCINTVNRGKKSGDWSLELDWPLSKPPQFAFVYTQPNTVRALPFTFKDDVLQFKGPPERLASIVIVAKEDATHSLRVAAYMPMDIPAKDVVRVSLANASNKDIKGKIRLGTQKLLNSEKNVYPFELAAGQAKVVDISVTGTSDLQDFAELPLEIDLGKAGTSTAVVQVAPTLPNGEFELDELDDGVPDHWESGIRLPLENGSGHCLSVAAHPHYTIRSYVKAPAHLRPLTRYRVSFRARTNNDKVYLGVFENDLHKKNIKNHSFHLPETGTWKDFEFEFETSAKADAGFSILTFRCKGKDPRDGAWIDDVRLEILGPASSGDKES